MLSWLKLRNPMALVVVLLACSATAKGVATAELPITGDDVAAAVKAAQECPSPIWNPKPGPSMKYGCFCGGGYPGLKHKSGKAESGLSTAETRELALDYLRIRPVDDVDAACQAHDVCWLLRRDGHSACNNALDQRTKYLQKNFESKFSWWEIPRGKEARCARLALLIGFATIAVMKHRDGDQSNVVGTWAARIVGAPLIVGAGGLVMLLRELPQPGERCDLLPTKGQSPSQAETDSSSAADKNLATTGVDGESSVRSP